MQYLNDRALLFSCFCMHYTRFRRHKPSPLQQQPPPCSFSPTQTNTLWFLIVPFQISYCFRVFFCFQLLFCFTLGLSFRSFYCPCGPYTKLLIYSGVSFNQSAVECIMECLEMRYTSREQSLKTKECTGEACHFLRSTLLQILLHKHKTNHSDVVNV